MPEAEAPARPPIDPEELAAFLDGRLEGERRQLMIARLADDEDAYDLYDEVIRVREELAAAETAAGAAAPASAPVGEEPAAPAPPPAEAPGGLGGLRGPEKRRPWKFPTGSRRRIATRAADGPRSPGEPTERRGWAFPTGSRRRTVGWFAMAAAAAAAVIAFGLWWLFRPLAPPPSTDLLATFDPASLTTEAAGAAAERLGTVFRGTTEERAAQFKLGVRAFDLALAVQVRDAGATERWLEEMPRLLDAVPFAIGLPERYQRLADRLDSRATPAELLAGIAAAESVVEEGLDDPAQPLFAFGRWVEAMRVAAVRGDRAALASPSTRRSLRRFLRSDPSEEVARQLATVAPGLGRGAATADLAALVDALKKIEDHCADGRPCLGPATE